jgi:hypothetical protein
MRGENFVAHQCAVEHRLHIIGICQENVDWLKLNGLNQELTYADDINLLGENVSTIKNNTEIILHASKELVWK